MVMAQLANERVQFRVRKTVLEMLRDRGYDTGSAEYEETFEDFCQKLEDHPTDERHIIAKRPVDAGEENNPESTAKWDPIFVRFVKSSQKIDKDFIGMIVRFMDDWINKANHKEQGYLELRTTVLIVNQGATSIARKVSILLIKI